ncbi:MAG: GNAT family N-acetyltransferase [Oscillospiraceae bacterium]|nr:GNAT family N-acetyltransferase [Oscillospiraceae bacterium]
MNNNIITASPLTKSEMHQICSWRYPRPYDIYNLPAYDEIIAAGTGFANPQKAKNYHSYYCDGNFIGYTNIAPKADGVYIGISLRPDICGKGYGVQILKQACKIAERLYPDSQICLQVRSWNIRAIKCYEKAGFAIQGPPFTQVTGVGAGEFYLMVKNNTVCGNQQDFLSYAENFAEEYHTKIKLSGSFRKGTATDFSDIDISFFCNNIDMVRKFIFGYSGPIYISHTTNPPGIIIVIYPDGVALDLDVLPDTGTSQRDTEICHLLSFSEDEHYLMARLLHRSLIKFLSGKKEAGVSVLKEICDFLDVDYNISFSGFKSDFINVLNEFKKYYPVDEGYMQLLLNLVDYL